MIIRMNVQPNKRSERYKKILLLLVIIATLLNTPPIQSLVIESCKADENNYLAFDLKDYTEININGETIPNVNIAVGESILLNLNFSPNQVGIEYREGVNYSFSDKTKLKLIDAWYDEYVAVEAGDCIVTATYNGITAKVNVHINAREVKFNLSAFSKVEEIEIDGMKIPRVDVRYGENFNLDLQYLSYNGRIDDDYVEYTIFNVISKKVEQSSYWKLEPGDYIVTASYMGATTKMYVHVAARSIEFYTENLGKISYVDFEGETIPSIDVAVGDQFSLSIQDMLEPGMYIETLEINYDISNKKIVALNNAEYMLFDCLKAGDSIVTATYGGATAEINIHAYDVKYSLKSKKYSIRYGKTADVIFVRDDEQEAHYPIEYTTSDKNVAIYDFNANYIIAKNAGTCTITFTMDNGQELSCTVTVPTLNIEEKLISQAAYTTYWYGTGSQVIKNKKYSYTYITFNNRKSKDKEISYIEYSVFQYDGKKVRINTNKSDFIFDESIYDYETYKLYLPSNVKNVRVCIKKVYYSDDTTWTNPIYKDWVKKYKSKPNL